MNGTSYESVSGGGGGGGANASADHNSSWGECPPSGWDYLFAFTAPSSLSEGVHRRRRRSRHSHAKYDSARRYLLSQLRDASFVYSQLWLPANSLYLVRVAMPEPVLMHKAERMGLRLRLARRFGGGYMAFSRKHAEAFENHAWSAGGGGSRPYFTPDQRLRITLATLNSRESWGVDLSINRLFRKRVLLQALPLHAQPEKDALLRDIVYTREHLLPWRGGGRRCLDQLKNYFGPRIAIYFAWLAFYTRMLIGFSGVSVLVYVAILFADRRQQWVADLLRVLYGVSISFWSTYWLEHWQRRNAVINAHWGLSDDPDHSENDIRQDFRGAEIPGFYSRGGFVHLSDLTNTPVLLSSASSSDAEGNECAVDGDVERCPQRSEDMEDLYSWSGYTESIASDHESETPLMMFNRLIGRHPVETQRMEDPHAMIDGEEYVLIGGEKDVDFRVIAPVTGSKFEDVPRFPFFDQRAHRKRLLISLAVTLLFATIIALLQFGITYFKREFSQALGFARNEAWPAGIATGILIVAADAGWTTVASEIVKWENHHANQSFENSLIRKRFAFQFVSNYFSLFYIAFVKPFTVGDPCQLDSLGVPNCMDELGTTLLTIIATKATIEQIIEVAVPYVIFVLNTGIRDAGTHRMNILHADERARLLEHGAIFDDAATERRIPSLNESKRAEYEHTIDDFSELVILHGFIALFGMACPLIVAIAVLSNLIEFRLDCYKMLVVFQRPRAEFAVGIGEWKHILNAMSTLSVLTMVGMTSITSQASHRLFPALFGKAAGEHPIVSFLIFEHILLFVRWAVGNLINQVPGSTHRLKLRREFLIAKFFDVGWKPHFRGQRVETHKEE